MVNELPEAVTTVGTIDAIALKPGIAKLTVVVSADWAGELSRLMEGTVRLRIEPVQPSVQLPMAEPGDAAAGKDEEQHEDGSAADAVGPPEPGVCPLCGSVIAGDGDWLPHLDSEHGIGQAEWVAALDGGCIYCEWYTADQFASEPGAAGLRHLITSHTLIATPQEPGEPAEEQGEGPLQRMADGREYCSACDVYVPAGGGAEHVASNLHARRAKAKAEAEAPA